jgi:CheY-like chemotaxis protein
VKTFLLVESDPSTRDHLAEGVAGMTDEIRVLCAGDGEEAARILAAGPVDILATALVMPVMDGFELLSFVLEEHAGIEIVVMGESELGRASQALCVGGAFRFLSKPVAAEDLIEVVRDILARPASGRLTGLSLPGFLQLLSAEGRTCCLRVRAPGHEGRLDLYDGQLINASCNGAEGKAAFFEILRGRNPEFEVEEASRSAARLIDDQLSSLLLEAALRHDGADLDASGPEPAGPLADDYGRGQGRSGGSPAPGDPGQMVGSFTTFAEVPWRLEMDAATRGLRAFMRFEGTLGAGVIDFETGRSLAHVCRGRDTYFIKLATEAARAVREGMREIDDPHLRQTVRQFKLYGSKHFQLIRLVRGEPKLLLVFAGLLGRTDIGAAGSLLADFEERIRQSYDGAASAVDGGG